MQNNDNQSECTMYIVHYVRSNFYGKEEKKWKKEDEPKALFNAKICYVKIEPLENLIN